jgi:hydrogenase maturation protease
VSISVLAAGSWLLSFDRVGPRVLARLGDLERLGVELSDLGTSGLRLLDQLHGQEPVAVVDACAGRGRPGEVMVCEPDLEPPRGATVHQLGPMEALAIAARLYPERLPRRLQLVLVETAGLPEHEEDAVCREAEATVRGLVRDVLAQRSVA